MMMLCQEQIISYKPECSDIIDLWLMKNERNAKGNPNPTLYHNIAFFRCKGRLFHRLTDPSLKLYQPLPDWMWR